MGAPRLPVPEKLGVCLLNQGCRTGKLKDFSSVCEDPFAGQTVRLHVLVFFHLFVQAPNRWPWPSSLRTPWCWTQSTTEGYRGMGSTCTSSTQRRWGSSQGKNTTREAFARPKKPTKKELYCCFQRFKYESRGIYDPIKKTFTAGKYNSVNRCLKMELCANLSMLFFPASHWQGRHGAGGDRGCPVRHIWPVRPLLANKAFYIQHIKKKLAMIWKSTICLFTQDSLHLPPPCPRRLFW